MLFHMPKKQIQNLTLKIDDVNIEMVEKLIFLGLTMDTIISNGKNTPKKSQISVRR